MISGGGGGSKEWPNTAGQHSVCDFDFDFLVFSVGESVMKFCLQDGSGTIEGEELTGLVKDLLAYYCVEYDINDLEDTKTALLSSCDSNSDGKINLKELSLILNLMADEQGLE